MKIGSGSILGIVGGILTMVGCFLPWVTIQASGIILAGTYAGPMLLAIFGIIGLICVAIPKKGTAIVALIMAVIAFLLWGLNYAGLALLAGLSAGTTVNFTVEYGVWVTLIGIILLLVGSIMAMVQAGKAAKAPPPQMMTPPPVQ